MPRENSKDESKEDGADPDRSYTVGNTFVTYLVIGAGLAAGLTVVGYACTKIIVEKDPEDRGE